MGEGRGWPAGLGNVCNVKTYNDTVLLLLVLVLKHVFVT